ncbi:MAG TPA: hypothetical protein VFX50_03995, partial [Gemmatimonadales bacterium]|nr:hypothetical protein [Gemmatimonadales bacterium]
APPGYARFVRRVVTGLLTGAAALAAAFAALQAPFDRGSFELGREHEASGIVRAHPAPMLVVPSPAAAQSATALLVRAWKHGAAAEAAALDGHRVTVRAHRVASPHGEMLQLVPGSIQDHGASGSAPAHEPLGRFRLRGELVDSKCYLGVMKPGRGKPHRGCAARCLSGGIPPLLLVEDRDGERVALLVATDDGAPLPRGLLDHVGESVELEGEVARHDGVLTLTLASEARPR